MDKPDDTTEFFLRACAEGNIEVVQSLIAEHIFHRAPSQNSGSSSDGSAVGIRNLFKNAAEQEGGGSHYFIAEGWSALHCAVYNGQKDVVRIILDHLRCRDTFVSGAELLPVAIARRLLACVSTCLGGGVGTRWAKNSLEGDAYRKALYVNARGAVPPPATRIAQLQAHNNNNNANNINPHCVSITALHMAVCLHGELLTQAVDAGDVGATEQRARSLRSIVRLLLNVGEADEEKGLDVTCKCDDVRETKTGSGGDVTAQPDNNVYTTGSKRTLTSANGVGPQRIRKGPIADVNIPSTDHEAPLHTAASMCDIQMLELLLSPSLVPPASGKSSTPTLGEGIRRSTDNEVAAEGTNQTSTQGGTLCAFPSNGEEDFRSATGTRSGTSLDATVDLGDTASTLDSIALSFKPLIKYLVGTLVILLLAYFGESKNGDDDSSNTKDVDAAVATGVHSVGGGGGEGSAQEGGPSWISETTMWMCTSFLLGLIVLFWVLDGFIFNSRTNNRKRTPLKRCLTFIAENCGLRKYLSSVSSDIQTHFPRSNLDREAYSDNDDTLYRTRGYPSARLLVSKGAKAEKVFSFWVSSGLDRCPLEAVFLTDFLDYYAFGAYPYVVDDLAVTAAEEENTTTGTFFESPHYLLRSHVSITSSPSHVCAKRKMLARRPHLIAVDLITLFLAAGGTSARLDESTEKSTGATVAAETFFTAKFLIEVVRDGILHLRNVSALLQTLIDHGLDCDVVYPFRIEMEENDANNNNNNNRAVRSDDGEPKPTKFVYDTLLMMLARNKNHKLLSSRVGDLDRFIIPQKALPRPSLRDLGLEDPSSLIPLREQSLREVAVSIYKDVVRVVMANMSDGAHWHVENSRSLKPHLKKGIYPSPPPSSAIRDEEKPKGPARKVKNFFSCLVRGYDDGCTALDVAISEGNTAFVEAFCSVARISKESQIKLWAETKR